MRLVCLAISVVLAAQLMPLPVAAQTLAAKGPWTVTSDADSCALQRQFGAGENTAALELRRFFRGDVRAVLSSTNLHPSQSIQIRYRLNGEEWRSDVGKYNVAMSNGHNKVVFFPWAFLLPEAHEISDPEDLNDFLLQADLPAIEKEAAAMVGTLTLEDAFEQPVSVELGSLVEPIEMMNECFDDLLTSWTIDAEADRTLSRRAMPAESTSELLTTFPPISYLFHEMRPNDLTIRLMISATGEIEACNFDKFRDHPTVVESSCQGLRRNVRFEPALDKEGHPIRSYFVYRYINPNEREPAG